MASIRELAILAVVAALGAAGTPAQTVTRSMLDQVSETSLPCFDVTPDEERPDSDDDRNSVMRSLTVVVRAVVDAEDDSALDPFYVFALKQLTGANANLGGTVINVDEKGTTAIFRPEGRTIIGLEMRFELTFATKRGDPTQRG